MPTSIPYSDEVWGFFVGCKPVSSGCANCWAPGLCGGRLSRLPGYGAVVEKVDGRWRWNGNVHRLGDRTDTWYRPMRWRKPRVIFVQSKSDLFYSFHARMYFNHVVTMANSTSRHTYLLLTKRPQIMAECVAALKEPLPDNVWLGVSVEDQATADERIPILCEIPCAHRWIRYEPALGPIDASAYLSPSEWSTILANVAWVVGGCESGPNRRPAELDWFRSVRDQCAAAGVRYYHKQHSLMGYRRGSKTVKGQVLTLPLLDGVRHDDVPWEVRDGE